MMFVHMIDTQFCLSRRHISSALVSVFCNTSWEGDMFFKHEEQHPSDRKVDMWEGGRLVHRLSCAFQPSSRFFLAQEFFCFSGLCDTSLSLCRFLSLLFLFLFFFSSSILLSVLLPRSSHPFSSPVPLVFPLCLSLLLPQFRVAAAMTVIKRCSFWRRLFNVVAM